MATLSSQLFVRIDAFNALEQQHALLSQTYGQLQATCQQLQTQLRETKEACVAMDQARGYASIDECPSSYVVEVLAGPGYMCGTWYWYSMVMAPLMNACCHLVFARCDGQHYLHDTQ